MRNPKILTQRRPTAHAPSSGRGRAAARGGRWGGIRRGYPLGNGAVGGVKLAVYLATPLVIRSSSAQPLYDPTSWVLYPNPTVVPVKLVVFVVAEPCSTPSMNRRTEPDSLVTATCIHTLAAHAADA